jgi:hypothetical protein
METTAGFAYLSHLASSLVFNRRAWLAIITHLFLWLAQMHLILPLSYIVLSAFNDLINLCSSLALSSNIKCSMLYNHNFYNLFYSFFYS